MQNIIINWFFIQLFLIQIKSFITYQQGYSDSFNNQKGFSCQNTTSTMVNITFAGTFENPPQILTSITKLSMNYASYPFAKIDIITVTIDCKNYYYEDFQIQISCGGVSWYQYQWYAVNDDRITILHPPTQTNLTDGSIFLHTHSLIKANKGFVTIDSFKHQGRPINFHLEVYQVTSNFVQIKLNNFSSKLLELGYSIVLGTNEAFQLGDLIFTSGDPYSGSIQQLNLGIFLLSINGFYWDQNDLIRIYISSQQSNSNFQYEVKSYSTTYMNSIRFQEVQFFKQILFPMYTYSYRVTKKYERYIQSLIKIQLLELNQQFISIGDFNVVVPEQMTTITIQIEMKFMPNEQLTGKFQKCNECGLKNIFKIEQNYLGGYNFIRYRLLLRQYSIKTQNLIISIGLSTVNIKQIINQVVPNHDIVQLQFISLIS